MTLKSKIKNDKDIVQTSPYDWRVMKKHGYTSVINGQKYMLFRDESTGGTVMRPVRIVKKEIYVKG